MASDEQVRRCRCGTRLARDNRGVLCHTCTKANRTLPARPPTVAAGFWRAPQMRAALATCDMGSVMRAFRTHPDHGRNIPQHIAAGWVGITQTRLSRIENGEQITNLNKLARWADVLGIPGDLRWFRIPVAGKDLRSDAASDGDAMSSLSRRSLLSRGIAAAALPALGVEEAQHLDKALTDARRYLDGDVVRYFSRQIGAAMAGNRAVGAPKQALPVVLGVVGAIERSAREVRPAVRRELLAVGAQGAEFCGWLYRELRRQAAGCFWLDRGMEWAQEAGDTAMQGYLLLKKCQMAYDERDASRVFTLASAAAEGPWRLPVKVRAEVVEHEALGMAMLGEPMGQVERKLGRARQLFARATDERQHGTLGIYFTERTLELHVAHCYTEAGAPKRAAELYARTLTGNTLSRRDIALHGARRALALARSGEPDEAATVGLKSARVAQAMHSQRTLRVLDEVERTLVPWRSRTSPRELHEALRRGPRPGDPLF